MRYSIEPRDRIYVKEYGFLSFAKNMGKNLSNKYGQKLHNSAKKFTIWLPIYICDLIGNKIGDIITSVSKKTSSKELPNNQTEEDAEITIHKRDTYLQKKDNKLLTNCG